MPTARARVENWIHTLATELHHCQQKIKERAYTQKSKTYFLYNLSVTNDQKNKNNFVATLK